MQINSDYANVHFSYLEERKNNRFRKQTSLMQQISVLDHHPQPQAAARSNRNSCYLKKKFQTTSQRGVTNNSSMSSGQSSVKQDRFTIKKAGGGGGAAAVSNRNSLLATDIHRQIMNQSQLVTSSTVRDSEETSIMINKPSLAAAITGRRTIAR